MLLADVTHIRQGAPAIDLARRHVAASITAALAASTPSADDFGDPMPPHGSSSSSSSLGSRRRGPGSPSTSPLPVASHTPPIPSSTYFYVFGHQNRFDTYPRWADGVYADDLAYVFGAPIAALVDQGSSAGEIDPFPTVYSRPDRTLSETVMRYWSNFIHTG